MRIRRTFSSFLVSDNGEKERVEVVDVGDIRAKYNVRVGNRFEYSLEMWEELKRIVDNLIKEKDA